MRDAPGKLHCVPWCVTLQPLVFSAGTGASRRTEIALYARGHAVGVVGSIRHYTVHKFLGVPFAVHLGRVVYGVPYFSPSQR